MFKPENVLISLLMICCSNIHETQKGEKMENKKIDPAKKTKFSKTKYEVFLEYFKMASE